MPVFARVFGRLAALRRQRSRSADGAARDADSDRAGFDRSDVAMAAHDCLNLLAVMTACADAMYAATADASGPAGPADDYAVFHGAALRLHHIARELIDDDAVPSDEVIDLTRTITRSEPMLARVLPAGVTLRLELAELSGGVLAHQWDIERVLLNLVRSISRDLVGGEAVIVQTASMKEVPRGLRTPHIRTMSYVSLVVTHGGTEPSHQRSAVRAAFWGPQAVNDLCMATVARSVQRLGGRLQMHLDADRRTQIRVDLPLTLERPLGG